MAHWRCFLPVVWRHGRHPSPSACRSSRPSRPPSRGQRRRQHRSVRVRITTRSGPATRCTALPSSSAWITASLRPGTALMLRVSARVSSCVCRRPRGWSLRRCARRPVVSKHSPWAASVAPWPGVPGPNPAAYASRIRTRLMRRCQASSPSPPFPPNPRRTVRRATMTSAGSGR
jgi:hypothetical protein